MDPRMPTFLVVGAAKAGTTACYFHLKAHPQIFMSPVKEPRFFLSDGADREAYGRLFDAAAPGQPRGEASAGYLTAAGCAERIRAHVPGVRIVAILRDPVERAYSQFLDQIRRGNERERDFLKALDAEPGRTRGGGAPQFEYAARGFYHRHLSRYVGLFAREQIRVYLYDDLRRDAAAILRDLYAFVGADPEFRPDLDRTYNLSGVPKSRLLYGSYQRLAAAARRAERAGLVPGRVLHSNAVARASLAFQRRVLDRPPMPEGARSRLAAVFREDVLRLEDLIGRDLSRWLTTY